MKADTHLEFSVPALETVRSDLLLSHDIDLRVLRLDKINPHVTGNKWYKLKYNIQHALQQGHTRVLSFGGAYSNHLYALAAVAPHFGLQAIGVIRGELPDPLNPVLAFTEAHGMQLLSVSRDEYRQKQTPQFLESLQQRFGSCYVIPEGGSNQLGMHGCKDIINDLDWTSAHTGPKVLALACGTGTTMAGLLAAYATRDRTLPRPEIIGIPVLKGGEFLEQDIRQHLAEGGITDPGNWHLETQFHCGGYGRTSPELLEFVAQFSGSSGIPIEPVYTGKLFMGIFQLIAAGTIAKGSEVIIIHSGGLHYKCGKNSHAC